MIPYVWHTYKDRDSNSQNKTKTRTMLKEQLRKEVEEVVNNKENK